MNLGCYPMFMGLILFFLCLAKSGRAFFQTQTLIIMQVKDIQGEADYNEIRQIVMHRTGENPDTVRDILDTFWDVLAEVLAIHDRAELHGVGVIKLEDRKERDGIDPQGNPYHTPERRSIEFHASDAYAEKVRAFTGEETPII